MTRNYELEVDGEKPVAFPVAKIHSYENIIEREGRVYARMINMLWHVNKVPYILKVRERLQLQIDEWLKKDKVEVLLEITQGDIILLEENAQRQKLPKGYIGAKFLSINDSYIFFPELVDFMNSQTNNFDEDAFDWLVEEVFANYSDNGFGSDPYSSYYMVETSNGTFLLNEYYFEEKVESILPGASVGIRMDELLLRSMNKYLPPDLAFKLTEEEKRKLALHQERLAAYEAMQERIRIRRANGEGQSLV